MGLTTRPDFGLLKDKALVTKIVLLMQSNVLTTDELRALLDRNHITFHEYVEVLIQYNNIKLEEEKNDKERTV